MDSWQSAPTTRSRVEVTLAGEFLQDQVLLAPAVVCDDLSEASGTAVDDGASHRSRWKCVTKRAIDVIVSALTLIILLPLLAVIALVVLLLDGRPILFPWDVVGEHGRPFRGYKFRTMVVGADALRPKLAAQNEMTGPVFKMRNDPRVTRIGSFLRRYSLDELPQLWSVLKGDMSLVGPRPLGPQEYAEATPYQRRKLSVMPGITCLWQVQGRSQINDFDAWVSLDLRYIAEWSLLLDLKILAKTIPAVLTRKGAW